MNQHLLDKQDKEIDYVDFRVHLYEQKVSKTFQKPRKRLDLYLKIR